MAIIERSKETIEKITVRLSDKDVRDIVEKHVRLDPNTFGFEVVSYDEDVSSGGCFNGLDIRMERRK